MFRFTLCLVTACGLQAATPSTGRASIIAPHTSPAPISARTRDAEIGVKGPDIRLWFRLPPPSDRANESLVSSCVASTDEPGDRKSVARHFLETLFENTGAIAGGLVGGAVGLATAGPGGAIVGSVAGAAGGQGLMKYLLQPARPAAPAKQP